MRAIVYQGAEAFPMAQRPRPALPPGGAVARVLCASICGTDLRAWRFGSEKLTQGRVLGHEGCLVLEETDPALERFAPGERVVLAPAVGCGVCPPCKKGHTNMCNNLHTFGFEWDGTFAEYCAIPAQAFAMGNVLKAPAGLGMVTAGLAEPVACALNAQRYLAIAPGDRVLVFGGGYLGCVHAELAFLAGAEQVLLAEVSEKRRRQAGRDVPRAIILDSADAGFQSAVVKATGGAGVDAVITACPAGVTHRIGLELLNKLGRISLFGGLPGDGGGFLNSNLIHYKELCVYGAHASTVRDNLEALEIIADGRLNVDKYAAEFAFEDIREAMAAAVAEEVCKPVLRW